MTYTPNQIALIIEGFFGHAPSGLLQRANEGPDGNAIYTDPPAAEKQAAIAWLDTAIAIVLAESGGNPKAHNKSGASGLWQIMMPLHKSLVDEAIIAVASDVGVAKNKLDVFDPRVNTAVAGRLYASSGWKPWASDFGARHRYTGHGAAAWAFLNSPKVRADRESKYVNEINYGNTLIGAGTLAMDPLATAYGAGESVTDSVSNVANKVLAFVKDAGMSIGVFVLALILIVLGVVFFIAQSRTAKRAAKFAAKRIV